MTDPGLGRRFACTPSPRRRAGRRRLALLLVLLALAAMTAAALAWADGRRMAALLALAVAGVPLFAWRMSGDLDPVELWVDANRVTLRTRRHLLTWPAAGATGRRLGDDEVSNVTGLSQTAGFLTSAGGFDSHRLGEFTLYASDLDNAVLVDLGDEHLVLTPDDPAGFLAALRGQAL